jgi:hypothetical protein
MSRTSDAKKARRRKRQAARDASWLPEPMVDRILAGEDRLDAVDAAVAEIDDWLTPRGWVLDTDNTDVVSWFFPPSAAEFDDDDIEPVTRIWIALDEDDDEVVLEFGSVLVGFRPDDEPYVLDPDTLADDIDALEGYRSGLPRPVLN